MSERRKDFFKRTGYFALKALVGIYIFAAGIVLFAIVLVYFFNRGSAGFNGEFGAWLVGKELLIMVITAATGVGAFFFYNRLPDFEDILNPDDEDY